jgi:transcriptional regulator with AAA-type ATPase domain/NAD-dependent dihydropyrimidine dehydrogenase PreA subunit
MSGKKIGSYLVEVEACDESAISRALELQSTLSQGGVYKPVGEIVVEDLGMSSEDLDRALQRQRVDILSSASLFKSLAPESISEIAGVARHFVLPQNTTIFHERDPGDAFFIVISGRVRVFRTSEEETEITLTTLEPGAGFGEMALLTGEPRSASVETVEPTSLLVVPKNAFDEVIAENPELTNTFVKILSERLTRTNIDLARATDTERAYQRFVSEQSAGSEPELIGETRVIRGLRAKIEEASTNERPVLITGEPGTEKRDVGGLIHQGGGRSDDPVLMLDANAVSLVGSTPGSRHRDPLQLELAQDSALFGHERSAFSFAKTRRLGLLEVCREGTIVIENVDHLAESVQTKLAEFIVSGRFRPMGGQRIGQSSARVIATTSCDLEQLVEAGKFDRRLYELLAPQTLSVPPLRKRKRDLRLIVNRLIEKHSELAEKSVKGIDSEAYNQIMTYDWSGNTDELDVVIRRAVSLAEAESLMPEDLFIGPAPVEGRITFNLLKLDQVRRVFQSKLFPLAPQLVTGFFIGLLICLGLFGTQVPDSNVSVILCWALWWPLLVLSWFLVARGWCAVCPVGALSNFFSRFCSLKLKAPRFLRNYGIYLGASGLGIIVWAEAAASMPISPKATAFLLLGITTCAIAFGLIYQRRVWCRYLCPLGRLSGALSRFSVLELRSNTNVCNNDCTTHGCYVGDGEQSGCPMYEGPFSLSSNQDCILCGNCVKICPDRAPRLNLRLPGHELWTVLKPEHAMAVLVSVIVGTQLFRSLEAAPIFRRLDAGLGQHWALLGLLMLGTTLLAYLFVTAVRSMVFSPVKDQKIEKTSLVAYALIPLAFSFELGYHLRPLLERAGLFIPVLGRQMANRLVARHQQDPPPGLAWRRRLPILLLVATYIWLFASV